MVGAAVGDEDSSVPKVPVWAKIYLDICLNCTFHSSVSQQLKIKTREN